MASDKLQQWLLRAGLVISAALLIRFAIDFSMKMRWWLAAPFWLLLIAALATGAVNVVSLPKFQGTSQPRIRDRALLLAAIPLGFLTSSLGCTGLSLHGCSPFCTFVKLVWIPLIAAACVGYLFALKRALLTAIVVMSFVPLIPHCVCYNVGNAWWIDRLGASPLCYGWGFVVSVIALGALLKGKNLLQSLAICFAIVGGSTAFFVAHHYFHFPW
ncbi:MAG TPA: hypothetical protein VKF81_09980 [Blastocatellia bacterium]|nr:hypothetical protein [Blastocatellia bacterium]